MTDNKPDTTHREKGRPEEATANAQHQAPLLSGAIEEPRRRRYVPRISANKARESVAWSSWWWWEIGGTILALLCLFLTIAVLKALDGKITDTWKLSIEPNSLLSVLTTIGKLGLTLVVGSCLSQLKWSHFQEPNSLSHLDVLDETSRSGPWGTAIMLLKLRSSLLKRGTGFMIALLALITILSFAIDPMIQQTLTTQEDDYQLHNLTASILTNKHYDARAHDLKESFEKSNRPNANGDQLIIHESSLFSQLTNTTLRPDINCPAPGTRCEFQNITMLGLCSETLNITDKVDRSCTRQGPGNMTCYHQLADPKPARELTINFGDGAGVDYQNFRSILDTLDPFVTMSEYSRKRVDVARLFTLKVVGEVNGNDFLNDTSLDAPATQVTMTNWYWCKKSFDGFSTNGRSEKLSVTGGANDEPLWITEPATDGGARINYFGTPEEVEESLNSASLQVVKTFSTNFFRMDFKTLFGIIDATWQQHLDPKTYGQLHPSISVASNNDVNGYIADTIGMASFMVNANMSELAERMAIAVTNQVQQKLHNTIGDTTNGTVHERTAYFIVTRAWLTLPLFEAVAAALLLFITILLNTLPLLRSSTVGVLAHGPENAVDYRVDGVETAGKWEKFGDEVKVVLMKDEKGWTRLIPL